MRLARLVIALLSLHVDIMLQGLHIADCEALVYNFGGEPQIVIERFVDERPAILVARSCPLTSHIVQNVFSVAVHGGNVAEEAIPLCPENSRRQLRSQILGRWCHGRKQRVEHRDAVGLAVRLQEHLIDQDLEGKT